MSYDRTFVANHDSSYKSSSAVDRSRLQAINYCSIKSLRVLYHLISHLPVNLQVFVDWSDVLLQFATARLIKSGDRCIRKKNSEYFKCKLHKVSRFETARLITNNSMLFLQFTIEASIKNLGQLCLFNLQLVSSYRTIIILTVDVFRHRKNSISNSAQYGSDHSSRKCDLPVDPLRYHSYKQSSSSRCNLERSIQLFYCTKDLVHRGFKPGGSFDRDHNGTFLRGLLLWDLFPRRWHSCFQNTFHCGPNNIYCGYQLLFFDGLGFIVVSIYRHEMSTQFQQNRDKEEHVDLHFTESVVLIVFLISTVHGNGSTYFSQS